MEYSMFAVYLLAMAVLPHVMCIQYECPPFNGSLLGNTDMPSQDGLISSMDTTNPLIQVFRFDIVCLAAGSTRDHYRFVTVAATYSCLGISCNGTRSSLFDLQCSNVTSRLEWTDYGNGSRQDLPTTDFPTPRTDCSSCLPPSEPPPVPYDPLTHCAACNEKCSGSGLGLCTGNLSTECCDFYQDNSCVVECPTDSVPDDDFNCVSLLSANCSSQLSSPINGNVSIFPETPLGPVAVYNCDDGYVLVGSSVRVCEPWGWSGNEPTCEVISESSEGSLSTALYASFVVVIGVLVTLSSICSGAIVVLGILYGREKKKRSQLVYELELASPAHASGNDLQGSSSSQITLTEADQSRGYITPGGEDPLVIRPIPSVSEPGHAFYENLKQLETSVASVVEAHDVSPYSSLRETGPDYENLKGHYQSLLVSSQDYTAVYSNPNLNHRMLTVERQGHDYYIVDPSKTNPPTVYDLAH